MIRTTPLLLCLLTLAACGLDKQDPGTTSKPASKAPRPSYSTSRSSLTVACPSSPATKAFNAGLCVCEDLAQVGDLVVTASTGGAQALVGVNGKTDLTGTPRIEGSMVAYRGLYGVGEVDVKGDLRTVMNLDGVGRLTIGGDLVVGGDLSGVGVLEVGGTVRVAGTFDPVVGTQTIGGLGAYTAPELPCPCGARAILDVKAEVAKAKQTHDNEKNGLPPQLELIGKADLTLDTGRYYFERAYTLGETKIEIRGAVALFIDGNLDAVGTQNIHLAPGATLDLYVAGNIELVGDSDFGGEPGSFRLYVGGTSPVAVSVGSLTMHGSLYAPQAEVSFVGDTRIEGALFARSLSGVGTLTIQPAEAARPSPEVCTPAAEVN